MLHVMTRGWRTYLEDRERSALAQRLGPHIARDIGIKCAISHRLLQPSQSH